MIRDFFNKLRQRKLRKTFCTGAELSRFIAKDVRRDIQVIDDSRIDDGYVTARVRTTNILYVSRKGEPMPSFDSPEILHLDRAWEWGGELWGGKEPTRPKIPLLTINELRNALSESFPQAKFSTEYVNPDYQSWRVTITVENKTLEFVWGPLSGFGGIDRDINNEDVFAFCNEYLYSLDDAIRFTISHVKQ